MPRILVAAALAATLMLPSLGQAHDFTVGGLKIGHPWARATPPAAPVAGAYLTVENTAGDADRLVSVAIPDISPRVEIHEMANNNGVMTMRPLPQGLPVAGGSKVELKPGGYHLMMMDIRKPLVAGEKVKATLVFEKAGPVNVEFVVSPMGSGGHEQGH